jgi:glycosyltransferase involved in cell wall biosynthesis
MRVAYIVAEFPRLTETFIERETEAVERQGVEVVVFALRRGAGTSDLQTRKLAAGHLFYRPSVWSPSFAAIASGLALRHPLHLVSLVGRTKLAYWRRPLVAIRSCFNLSAAAYFAWLARNLGIRHIHAQFASMPATVAWAMSRFSGLPYSVAAHARDIFVRDELLGEKLRCASLVVTCTEYGRRVLLEQHPGAASEKIVTVYHGLDLASYQRTRAEQGGLPLIVAIGRLIEKKGFEHLVRSCAALRDERRQFRCQIVGEGEQRTKLETLIAKLGLAETVTLTGARPRDAVIRLLSEATVLVAPSVVAPDGDRDGLPNVLLEALAMRVPVVASDVAGIPELVRDGETGLLTPPRDEHALARRMAELLDSSELRQKLAENGRREVERRFNVDANVRALVKLFGRDA